MFSLQKSLAPSPEKQERQEKEVHLGDYVKFLSVDSDITRLKCKRDEVEPEIATLEIRDVEADVGAVYLGSTLELDFGRGAGGCCVECGTRAIRGYGGDEGFWG